MYVENDQHNFQGELLIVPEKGERMGRGDSP